MALDYSHFSHLAILWVGWLSGGVPLLQGVLAMAVGPAHTTGLQSLRDLEALLAAGAGCLQHTGCHSTGSRL